MILVSLFDGIGGAYDSAVDAQLPITHHVAVEIDKSARDIADWRAMNNGWRRAARPVNDVCDATADNLLAGAPPGDVLLVGGVPCTTRSLGNYRMAGRDRTGEGMESGLICEYVRILNDLRRWRNVKFIVENVPSDRQADAHYNTLLDCDPVFIDAAAFGAQCRRRVFWSNFGILQPGVWSREVFDDISDASPDVKIYEYYSILPRSFDIRRPQRIGVIKNDYTKRHYGITNDARSGERVYNRMGKVPTITIGGGKSKVNIPGGNTCRKLTISEMERAFGLPCGATALPGVSMSRRKKAVAGAWHVKQMSHVMKNINRNIGMLNLKFHKIAM